MPFTSGRWHHGHKGKRSRWGLRRRLTQSFAFVALAAVSLTTWLILGAVMDAQKELFEFETSTAVEAPGWSWPHLRRPAFDSSGFTPAREAVRQITRTAFLAAFLSFFLASGAAAVMTRFLTRPLHALTEGAKRLEEGERGLRLELPTARDELRGLTEAFNNLVAGLERQEAWRRGMVADIAHDLRTPLSVMRSEIEGMQDGVVALDQAGLTRLHAEVMILSRLVADLRTLSLAEEGRLTLQLTPIRLQPLLQRSVEAFSARASQAGVELKLVTAPDDLTAQLDSDRIVQVIGNLLDNAIRYATPGTVELGADIDRGTNDVGEIRVWVRDHGPGLAEEELEQVFERFYRGDPSRSRSSQDRSESSSGLGLAIARAIVEAHGGILEAQNHPEGGAVFTLRLPAD
jgi:two-component system sensor histidine kinase BaeS